MRVLGIDPGYAIVGYGIVDYVGNRFTPVAYGVVTTPAHTPFEDRLALIYEDLARIMAEYRPEAVAVEKLYFTTNQKTVIEVSQARGVILLCARQQRLPIFEYTPLQVKQAVVGYGKAIKSQVMEMTRRMLGLAAIPKPDDAADALAIAICHAHTGSSLLRKYR